jgi:PAS domain S-box-containing protein
MVKPLKRKETSHMSNRLAQQLHSQLDWLVDQYDTQLRLIPGCMELPESERRSLERQILELMADCLETDNDQPLIDYLCQRAGQILAAGSAVQWFPQAIAVPATLVTPLMRTVAESNFIWKAVNHSQSMVWQLVADRTHQTEERFRSSERTLQESQQFLQLVLDNIPQAVFWKDRNSTFLGCNRNLAQAVGLARPEQIVGKSDYDVSPTKEEAEAFRADDRTVIESGQPKHHVIEPLHQADGTQAWLDTTKVPLRNAAGEVVGILGMFEDITERKRTEAALTRSAEKQQQLSQRLRAAIEAAEELMRAPDLDTLYRRVVELAREKLGVERCGLFIADPTRQFMLGTYGTDDQGCTTDEHAAREPIELHQAAMSLSHDQNWIAQEAPQTHWKEGQQQTIGAGWVGGTAIRSASGPIGMLYNDAAISQTPIDHDLQEALAVYCSMLGSVIESKRLEHELTTAQQQFQNIIEFLPDATFVIDRDKRVIAWNRAIEVMSGMAKEDILGKGNYEYALPFFGERRPLIIDLIGKPDKEIEAKYDYVQKQGDTLYAEAFVPTMFGGRGAHVWVTASPLLDDVGNFAGAIESIRDITERKRLDLQIRESLARRDVQVHTSTQVAQEIAAAPEVSELFQRVVTLIKERFNYYHAQLFRYDPAQNAVVLIAGYGEVGEKMLTSGHKLQMGRGVVGAAADSGQSILAADVTQDEDWRPNPYLPETKGELAVPIKLRDEVLGILDVQSDRTGALTEDDRLLLEGLCGQIATAMESTRLLEELRRGQAELAQALQIAKLAYWEYDVEQDLFHFNDQFYALFHTTAEQVGGYHISSAQYAGTFVYPDDLSAVGTEIERALNSTDRHYSRQLEHRIQYADGGVGYISVSINIDRDEQGHILRYYGANQDITERKQVEGALAQEQSLMRVLMDTVTDHIYFKDLQSRFLRISKSQADRFGLSNPATAVGKTDFDYFTEEHARPAYEDEQEIIRTGQPMTKEERETWQDQPDTWVSTTKFPLRDEANTIVGTFGISHNITERKRAEQKLQELLEKVQQSEQLMRTLIDAMPDHIYAKDLDGRLILVNLSEARLHGVETPDVLLGKSDFDFYPRKLAEQYWASEQLILRDGIPLYNHEEPNQDAAGHSFWSSTTKVPLRNTQGQIIGLVGKTTDITERKQAEVERNRLLKEQERRTIQLQTASEVSRAASSILNLDELLSQSAELIRTRFELYYVGIFLLDDTERWAVLRAGTGEAGQQMLADGHKLKIGGNSMISQCVTTQLARIALDVGEEATRFNNPVLPLTRSEMALPLVSRGRVIGAATIQSDQPAAFSSQDITVLQSMADQISNAVENARLYAQAREALQEVDAINRRLTGEAWDTYLRQQAGREVIWAADNDAAAPEALFQLNDQLAAGEIILEPDPEDQTAVTVTAPILLRGQPIGALRLHTPLDEWADDTQIMLAGIADHIAQAVENARLIEQTQRSAQRERSINEINARVRQSVDLDAILRTAVNELGQSLKAARVVARVGTLANESARPAAGDGRGKTND